MDVGLVSRAESDSKDGVRFLLPKYCVGDFDLSCMSASPFESAIAILRRVARV